MQLLKSKNLLVGFLISLLFLIVATFTMKDYGINWDEPFHFQRGQAYLHYFLTGKTNFLDLPAYPDLKGSNDFVSLKGQSELFDKAIKSKQGDVSGIRRSYFASDVYSLDYFLESDDGHPPVSDIFAAGFNYVLYQKLGIMGDLESHHFYEIVLSSILVFAVFLFVNHRHGTFPAIVAAISLSCYPLFFSESHFNIKDPPEAALFGLTLISFYFGIVRKSWKMVILSAIFAGVALGTKLNLLFAAPVAFIWFLFVRLNNVKRFFIDMKPIFLSLILYVPVTLGVVYILWPFLWSDPLGHTLKILGFYKQIGTGTPGEMAKYIVSGWNTYPTLWIIYTTQIPILILSGAGLIASLYSLFKKKDDFSLFILLWFLIPILRASYPNAGIYGGVRQIMEYIPAMAILSGVGAYHLINIFKKAKYIYVIIILGLAFSIFEMAKIHPNENVYFNQIIGGIRGARDKNIPYWGNTYGNVYMQGVEWLNDHAEPGAKLGLPIANMINIPRLKLRRDIDFSNAHWSGVTRQGEYEMEMDFEWPPKYWYSFQYYDKYLDPVFIAEVDGVPLLKLWKNDLAHTKSEFMDETTYKPLVLKFRRNKINQELYLDMGRELFLTRVTIKHSSKGCPVKSPPGYVALSSDNKTWKQEPDPINTPQVPVTATGWTDSNFVFLFPGRKARYVVIDPQTDQTCLFKSPSIEIKGLKVLP